MPKKAKNAKKAKATVEAGQDFPKATVIDLKALHPVQRQMLHNSLRQGGRGFLGALAFSTVSPEVVQALVDTQAEHDAQSVRGETGKKPSTKKKGGTAT